MSGEHERRQFHRIPMDRYAHLRCDDGTAHRALVLDISFDGALLAFADDPAPPLEAGAGCRLDWSLDEGVRIRMELEAVHVGDSRAGFRCRRIDLESMRCLRRLIELNLGDAALVERELEQLGEPLAPR